ncbi:MAG: HAD family hydrolase [Blastocatellia bacterium]|nr:HAD family hydrolase [Blastocatellia bacterium]
MENAAIFMDRDGTVSEEVGYVNHLSRFKVFPWTARAIKRVNEARLKACLITNQAGVARGYFKEELILQVHEKLALEIAKEGAVLDGIYYCPHHPTVGEPPYRQACNCRKPKPGLLERAAVEHKIDLTRSFMIGDRYSDMEVIRRVGGCAVMVLTGYGLGEYEYQRESWPTPPDFIAKDLEEAINWIIEKQSFS